MLRLSDFSPASVGDLTILTRKALRALASLCLRSTEYRANVGYYGDVHAKIKAAWQAGLAANVIAEVERTETQHDELSSAHTLAAVAFKLSAIPGIAVESEGSQDRKNFFSTQINWDELALDVLGALYVIVGDTAGVTSAFLVVDRLPLPPTDVSCYPVIADELSGVVRSYARYVTGRIEYIPD